MDPFLYQNLIWLIILITLLMLGTYFSSAEMAFSSLNRARIKSLADGGGKRGRRAALVSRMYENRFDEVISTLLICNNTVAITAATVSVALFLRLIGDMGYLVSTIVITVVVVVFTDIIPKSMSKEQPEKVALFCAPFLLVLMTLLRPITWLLIKMKNRISARFVSKEADFAGEEQAMRGQELLFMVEEAEKDGAINEDDSLRISNAIEFNDLLAWDILTPRIKIECIPHDATMRDISELFVESGYSRMPVYEDSLDTVKGIVHIRDFLRCMARTDEAGFNIDDIITPAVFTATSTPIPALLNLLKKEQSHMAIVTDEYGGTEGIVTMEDILKQLVGDIWDEHDEVIEEIVPIGENKYKVLCTADVYKLFDFLDIEAESESSTVNGWIMDMLRRIPEVGDSFTYDKLTVTVTKADQRRAEECEVKVSF